jgi:hypothetical protein
MRALFLCGGECACVFKTRPNESRAGGSLCGGALSHKLAVKYMRAHSWFFV